MKNFQELQLPLPLDRALQALAFVTPTPIQAQAIPVALSRQDLIACAQTGTGKTAAFCIPLAVRLLRAPGKAALVLAPTRELALQIEAFWKDLTRFAPELKCVSLIGGLAMQNQIKGLRGGARLVVATPGRLVDHLSRGTISLSKMEMLVLDEADRMLDMGFAPQLTQILRFLPKARQTLMFSATLPPDIDRLSSKYLKSPVQISASVNNQAAPKVNQTAIVLNAVNKNDTLLDELNQRQGSVLVFARTQARTDRVARYLSEYGLEVNRIHGGRSQGQRKQALTGFKSGKVRILVATDIAARGIDVTGIAHVINYDLPMLAEDYIHRIGRTARAGASGEALSLITPEDRGQWKEITRLLQKSGSSVPEERKGNMCRS
jgi:superfamily II DNA/RNA helicase